MNLIFENYGNLFIIFLSILVFILIAYLYFLNKRNSELEMENDKLDKQINDITKAAELLKKEKHEIIDKLINKDSYDIIKNNKKIKIKIIKKR